jgi:DNA transformation protein and related proteins
MTRPVSAIRNLGPKSAAMFARAGITSAEEIEALGAVAAFRRLKASGARPSVTMLYALAAGLSGRDWTFLTPDERADLRRAAAVESGGIEAELDRLGVGISRDGDETA